MTHRGLFKHLALFGFVPLAWGGAFAAPQPASETAPSDEPFGVYAVAPGHHIGINRFVDDAGERVALFADYRSGAVRRLHAESASEYLMGPSSATHEPVEMRIRLTSGAEGIKTVTMSPIDGEPVTASRVELREESITFSNGDARLAGTLIRPATPGPHPAIVLLHGSGPLTRYSFGPYPYFFASLGMAVLIFDKRGTGESTGTRLDASTGASAPIPDSFYPDVLVADALAAFRFLERQPGIDATRIGFWGSSEGGMLATQSAARESRVAFAINSSGFAGPLWETLLYQAGGIPRAAGRTPREVEDARAFAALWMDVARTGKNFDTFVARREEARRQGDWMLSYFSGFYTSVDQMRWDWDHILSFDSRPALARVKCPVLGMFGALDPLTDGPVAARALREELIRGGNRDVTTRVFPDGSHSLTELPDKRRMAPGVFDTLRDWLTQRVGLRAPTTPTG